VVVRRVVTKKEAELRVLPGGAASRRFSDEELILAVERGATPLAGEFYDYLISVVDHTLFRVLGRRESDHDDLIQTAFEQIIITLSTRSFARACSLRTWASTIASHVGLNALRSRQRERRVVDRTADLSIELPRSMIDPERETDARAELERIRSELADMNPKRSEVIVLHDVLGHDLSEIALITGVSVAAAQSRLVRGRHDLLKRLDRTSSGRSKLPKGARPR